MFSSGRFGFKNGEQRNGSSQQSIYRSINRNDIPHSKKFPKLETKLIISILSGLGITSYIGAIILNIGSWKADVLFFVALLFGVVKFIRYCLKTWQDFRKDELEIKVLKKKSEKP